MKPKIREETGKLYAWTCQVCGRTMRSQYATQLIVAAETHMKKHEREEGMRCRVTKSEEVER